MAAGNRAEWGDGMQGRRGGWKEVSSRPFGTRRALFAGYEPPKRHDGIDTEHPMPHLWQSKTARAARPTGA